MPEQPWPTDEQVAAALAAVQCYLDAEHHEKRDDCGGWHESARLAIQNLRPFRLSQAPSWGTIERLRRQASGGFFGVTGL